MYLPRSSIFGRWVVFMMSSIISGWIWNRLPICSMTSGSWIPTTSIHVAVGLPTYGASSSTAWIVRSSTCSAS